MFNYVPKLCLNNSEASKREKFTIATLSLFLIKLFEIPKQAKREQQKQNIFILSRAKLLHASSVNKLTSSEKEMQLGVYYCFKTLMIQ